MKRKLKEFLTYPTGWGLYLDSHYKSIWLGWWLITWKTDWDRDEMVIIPKDVSIRFMPSP